MAQGITIMRVAHRRWEKMTRHRSVWLWTPQGIGLVAIAASLETGSSVGPWPISRVANDPWEFHLVAAFN